MDKGLKQMKFFLRYILVIVFLVKGMNSFAQLKDTVQLNEVSVTDYRRQKTSGNFTGQKIDSITKINFITSSVSQLLLQQNGALVKAYGPGNIASLGIRGSTASQTAVLWNGININNPMLGQADISLLPAGFFDDISLQKGALSGYWGSGAMAGVLNLQNNEQPKGLMVQASTTYSSLQNITQWAKLSYGKGKFFSSTKLLLDQSQNKYQYYRNTDTSVVKETQRHALAKQLALMEDVGYKINANSQLALHLWYENANRQSPYTNSGLQDTASQRDHIFRSVADYKLNKNRLLLNAKIAFANEALLYDNSTINVHSNNNFKNLVADVDAQYKLPKGFALGLGTSNVFSKASSENYAGEKYQSRNALFENISFTSLKNKFNANIYAREELFNGNIFVPTYGATAGYNVLKWLRLKANAGTVYRYPTLNELYWHPGGNTKLLPESGYSMDGSAVIHGNVKNILFNITGTVFNRYIYNQIVWTPGAGGNWSPQNYQTARSRGLETNTEISYAKKHFFTKLNIVNNYILSQQTEKNNVIETTHYLQAMFTPMYSGSVFYFISYHNWMLRAAYTYTGYRYLSLDNYNYLKPYQLVDVRLSKTVELKNLSLNIYVEADNLLNENYQSYTSYDMPLRYYKTGIILQYKQPNKQQT